VEGKNGRGKMTDRGRGAAEPGGPRNDYDKIWVFLAVG
jgi:hypothetical protein